MPSSNSVNTLRKEAQMKILFTFRFGILLLLAGLGCEVLADNSIHHEIKIELDPSNSQISVVDSISNLPKEQKEFFLHENLKIKNNPRIKRIGAKKFGLIRLNHYSIKGHSKLELTYQGKISHQIQMRTAEYARSMQETPGIISSQGIFLAGSTYWIPYFTNQKISFDLSIKNIPSWHFMSQGKMHINKTTSQFIEGNPQEEIYLIGGPYYEYMQNNNKWRLGVLLKQPDEALANKYLSVTAQYMEMFSSLFGDYPYSKFYMVENFWDTGYGMPSFTLLGPKVIRFPFILHSSYPHEILHNWWGNGVYTDYVSGNWSEGLTTYLADHLIQEQKNRAYLYRRNTLQKYADYVNENQDFALNKFVTRHSSASQAVGYGKTLMFFHMLRKKIGDQNFVHMLREFYSQNKFKYATYADIQKAVEKITGTKQDKFFRQWVQIKGAPQIAIKDINYNKKGKNYAYTISLQQTQKHFIYDLQIPVEFLFTDGSSKQKVFKLTKKTAKKRYSFSKKLAKISIDPKFDVFRRVHTDEIPSALSKVFGAPQSLVIMPSKANRGMYQAYQKLITIWSNTQHTKFKVVNDKDLKKLPSQESIWVLGWQNKFRKLVNKEIKKLNVGVAKQGYSFNQSSADKSDSIILTVRNPNNKQGVVSFLSAGNPQAINGLARKLPHYGKYSFLAFKGTEPNNFLKGQWDTLNSPLQKTYKSTVKPREIYSENALARLPTEFSKLNLQKTVKKLAGPNTQGRELGSKELDQVANYLADQFKNAGLKPPNSSGYLQEWKTTVNSKGQLSLKNVVGYVAGVNPKFAKQGVLIAAHYDHLGKGWPDVHKGDEGKIHYGANDNASGIATLLEFARYSSRWQPQRSIIFAAFSAEESGLLGSKYFAENIKNLPQNEIIAMINLDSVGRLGEKPIQIFAADSAREWVHIFRGVSYVTGVKTQLIDKDFGASDQHSFLAKGIPSVMLFGGLNADYHRPSDTLEKIDYDGLLKVLKVLKESVEHLANRQDGLTVQIAGFKPVTPTKNGMGRRVSLGTIPDFTFTGSGVKISGVTPNSPAQRAGLRKGDIIVQINKNKIADLREFAQHLRKLKAGDGIKIFFKRKDRILDAETKVIAR